MLRQFSLSQGFVVLIAGIGLILLWPTIACALERQVDSSHETSDNISATGQENPRHLFALLGIDEQTWQNLTDDQPLSESDEQLALRILFYLERRFKWREIEQWSQPLDWSALEENPVAFRGYFWRVEGHPVGLQEIRLPEQRAQALGFSSWYICRLRLEDDQHEAVVVTHRVPRSWVEELPTAHRCQAEAVFLKWMRQADGTHLPVLVAKRIRWYPPNLLGRLGMDCGLLDDLYPPLPRQKLMQLSPNKLPVTEFLLSPRKKECFYQLLAAVGRAQPGELIQLARHNLQQEGKQQYSVVPLFNRPFSQIGKLVVLTGTARQVVPVVVDDEDVIARFGIKRYWQVALYTEDSQGNPLIFCLREIPEGMPTGSGGTYAERVTVAGFFFGTWAYKRPPKTNEPPDARPWQLAPLLIGRSLIWHPPPAKQSNPAWQVAAGIAVALLFVALVFWTWHAERTGRLARRFTTEPSPQEPEEPSSHTGDEVLP